MASWACLGRTINAVLTNKWGVHFSGTDCAQEMIFPEEKFLLRDCLDVEGNLHHFFKGYGTTIPPFYVRSLKNGLCYTSGEEVYTNTGQVILDHTTQKKPPVRWRRFLKNITHIQGKVAQLKQDGCERNYYHWLTECLGNLYLVKKSNFRPDFYVIDKSLPFQKQWLALLGLDEKQIVEPHLFIGADELIVPDLVSNWNSVYYRKHLSYNKIWLPCWVIDYYKECVIPNVKKLPKKNIYVSRQNAACRKVLNEQELVPILKKYDFEVIHAENLTIAEQLEVFCNAKAIVGMHGAGLTNAAFSDKGTPVLELNTQYYHDASYRILFSQTGQSYFYMVGETSNISVEPQKEDAYFEPKKFESALNRIFSRIEV